MDGETQVAETVESTEPAQQPAVSSNGRTADFESANSGSSPETASKEAEKPSGFDKVEFTPEQMERVNRLYGNMKRYENQANELKEINSKLIETVSQVQQEQSKVVSHLQFKDFETAESKLKDDARQAYAKGDLDGWFSANQRLSDIQVKKSMADVSRPQSPIQQQQPRQQAISPDDAINMALQKGDVSQEEANIYRAWVNETDASGSIKRPWINPSDIRNSSAAFEGRAVFGNPTFAGKSFADKLKEIDRRMGLAHQQNGNSVLPAGNLTRGTNTNKVLVSDYEARVAVRTKFGGPKAKSDDDHIEAWRQAKIKSAKGGRK